MAGGAPSAWLPLLLTLLSPSWAPLGAGTAAISVQAPARVRGFLGNSVMLPCHLQPLEPNLQVTLVTWIRRGPAGRDRSVAVFHPVRGPNVSEPGRMEFAAARPGAELLDASLVVSGLRAEDEANYTCQFATFPQGSRSACTWLRVLAKPQSTAEAQEVPLSPLTREPVPVARCISTGGRPPARITWPSHLHGMANQSQMPGPLPSTFTVTSLLTLMPSSQADGKNVTCRVEHESFEEPVLLPVILTLRYPPEVSISGYDGNWYLGLSGATLNCDVCSNPEPTGYDWNTTMGPLPPSAVAQGAQLLIHTVDKSINTTFICRVTNALGTGQGELTILVKEQPPREQSHSGMSSVVVISLTLGIVIFLSLLGCLIYCALSRYSRQDHYSSTANGGVSYSAVDTQASLPQDSMTEGMR